MISRQKFPQAFHGSWGCFSTAFQDGFPQPAGGADHRHAISGGFSLDTPSRRVLRCPSLLHPGNGQAPWNLALARGPVATSRALSILAPRGPNRKGHS